eukprot:CAMPEP_0185829070 /NCGR_PEP_ID=MMETSP1353-20130828/20_1 /TAXON_ID=1077150 /ORGANISM="Erythrolobus australicus, Strain CCMP3124" /LENGTH=53 /DNA_ID=CAMNT_0028526815 /DNA_START=302 /DNA_END=463 /DNA_ORIENTATION=-
MPDAVPSNVMAAMSELAMNVTSSPPGMSPESDLVGVFGHVSKLLTGRMVFPVA